MASAKLSIFHLARNGAERKTAAAAAVAEVINLIQSHNGAVSQRVNSAAAQPGVPSGTKRWLAGEGTSEETQVTDAGPARAGAALPGRCVNAPLTRTILPQESVQRNRPDAQLRPAGAGKKCPSSHIQSSVGNTSYSKRHLQPVGGAIIALKSRFLGLRPLTEKKRNKSGASSLWYMKHS